MSIFSSLYVAMSGIRSNEVGMSIIGDNIANMNTIGFKGSRGVFSDILNTTIMGEPGVSGVGQGSMATSVQRLVGQGALLQTGVSTDLAIGGNGFFMMQGQVSGTDATFYSRNGQFRIDEDGFLANMSGLQLLGFPANVATGDVNTNISPLLVGTQISPPKATNNVTLDVNLDPKEDQLGPGAVLDTTDEQTLASTSTFSTTTTWYDSLGEAHDVDLYYIHQQTGEWSWHAVVDQGELDPALAGNFQEIGNGALTFTSDGLLDTYTPPPPGPSLSIQFDGATAQDVSFDWGEAITTDAVAGIAGSGIGTSSYSTKSAVVTVSQDGFGAGDLTFIDFDRDGTIHGTFSNGDQRTLGRVAMANFLSPDQLNAVGGNMFLESPQSGEPAVGEPNTGGRGQIFSSSLEQSNVDLSNEFTNMIVTQRGFQASSRTVTTADQMLTELINLKR